MWSYTLFVCVCVCLCTFQAHHQWSYFGWQKYSTVQSADAGGSAARASGISSVFIHVLMSDQFSIYLCSLLSPSVTALQRTGASLGDDSSPASALLGGPVAQVRPISRPRHSSGTACAEASSRGNGLWTYGCGFTWDEGDGKKSLAQCFNDLPPAAASGGHCCPSRAGTEWKIIIC